MASTLSRISAKKLLETLTVDKVKEFEKEVLLSAANTIYVYVFHRCSEHYIMNIDFEKICIIYTESEEDFYEKILEKEQFLIMINFEFCSFIENEIYGNLFGFDCWDDDAIPLIMEKMKEDPEFKKYIMEYFKKFMIGHYFSFKKLSDLLKKNRN